MVHQNRPALHYSHNSQRKRKAKKRTANRPEKTAQTLKQIAPVIRKINPINRKRTIVLTMTMQK